MKSIPDLTQHAVLALINRYCKLGCWYYEDLNVLYKIKDNLIAEWVKTGEMVATKIIERESPAIAAMKEQIAKNGVDLDWLNYYNNEWREEMEGYEEFDFWRKLDKLANCTVEIPVPDEEQYKLIADYQQRLAAYGQRLSDYEVQRENYKQQLKQLKQDFVAQISTVEEILKSWLPQSRKNKRKQINKAISDLKNENLASPEILKIINLIKGKCDLNFNVPLNPVRPFAPVEPILYREIAPHEYSIGMLPELDAAIEWARTVLNRPNLQAADITDSLVSEDLEDIVSNQLLQLMQELAVATFKKVVDRELTDPKEIYDDLTALQLNYAPLGMRSYDDRSDGITKHGDYCKWHEINLSPTGMWLVEFQSQTNSDITFHIPYDRAKTLGLELVILPHCTSEETYGRSINDEEQKYYPLLDLLAVFGYSENNFPYELEVYVQQSSFNYFDYEFDDDDEFDDDEFI